MPIYEYCCKECGAVSEFLVGVGSKSPSLVCKQCGGIRLEKILSVAHPAKSPSRPTGQTCCGREERCSSPPCSTGTGCRKD